jgi:hypothetical protein
MRRTSLGALVLSALAAAASAGDADPAAIRAARDAVFKRTEFRYGEKAGKSFLEEWLDAYGEWVRDFYSRSPILFYAVFSGLALLLVVLVAHIVWTIRASRESEFDEGSAAETAIRNVDPAPLRARAIGHADAGRFDDAVRDLYTALVFTLDRRGVLRYARHKALLDYEMEARRDEGALAALRRFAGVYHPGSFGRRPPDRAHFDDLLASLDRLSAAS